MFRRWYVYFAAVLLLCTTAALLLAYVIHASSVAAREPITLRVALYPYVPDRHALFHKLELEFERRHPGVNLELVDEADFTDNYYDGGLERVDADVIEVDTILLADLIAAKRIAPIDLPDQNFVPEAIQAVTRNGVVYGVPHWVCGNFLFYREGNVGIANAKTWSELLEALHKSGDRLLVDFKGTSGLGEWYFTALADIHGFDRAQDLITSSDRPDVAAVKALSDVLGACPADMCRSRDLHDRSGFYARLFLRGGGHPLYVGYSESLSYGLQDSIENCTKDCLSDAKIAVRSLPSFGGEPKGKGIGWVDALSLSAHVAGRKRELAIAFIQFAVTASAYEAVLAPAWKKAPRYLLPARSNLLLNTAPLYPALMAAYSGRRTGTVPKLNERLRWFGKKLDCALPIPPEDRKAVEACKKGS